MITQNCVYTVVGLSYHAVPRTLLGLPHILQTHIYTPIHTNTHMHMHTSPLSLTLTHTHTHTLYTGWQTHITPGEP